MKRISKKTSLQFALIAGLTIACPQNSAGAPQQFRHVGNTAVKTNVAREHFDKLREAVESGEYKDSLLKPRTLDEIIAETVVTPDIPTFNRLLAPWVFSEYRELDKAPGITEINILPVPAETWRRAEIMQKLNKHLNREEKEEELDSIAKRRKYLDELWGTATEEAPVIAEEQITVEEPQEPLSILGDVRPAWLTSAYNAWNMQEDMMYTMMVEQPSRIEYAYWLLPVPPTLPEDDHSFKGFLKRSFVPVVNVQEAVIPEQEIEKKHWLHVVNGALQFSQAFVSENWYQGGNNHLALLINFLWDVQLNPVYHPNFLFQSTLSYKLGLNSTEDDNFHKYSISQDIFQYNLKMGYKATHNWYYSFTAQFKTQLLNNYPKNSQTRIASFLTPADLNLGLGMTYSKQNKKKTIQFNASIAPLSYNLRTAIDPKVDHNLFNIPQSAKTSSEFGSNAEITFNWQICPSVTYKTRLFLFTDYSYGMGDWENTFNFQFNKFLSTQLYANLRYDSSVDKNIAPKWNRWMLKEILSVGLSYTFSTKK